MVCLHEEDLFLTLLFPFCYLLSLTYCLRGSGVLPEPRNDLVCLSRQILLPSIVFESLMGLPHSRWFTFSQAFPSVSTLSSGILSESHTTQTAGTALDSLYTAPMFWWHDPIDSKERSGKQGTANTATLRHTGLCRAAPAAKPTGVLLEVGQD